MGWERLAALISEASVPIYALGGMTVLDIPKAFAQGAAGIAAISAACVGWLFRPINWLERVFAFAVAAVFIFPGWMFDAVGFAGLAAMLAWSYLTARSRQPVGSPVAEP